MDLECVGKLLDELKIMENKDTIRISDITNYSHKVGVLRGAMDVLDKEDRVVVKSTHPVIGIYLYDNKKMDELRLRLSISKKEYDTSNCDFKDSFDDRYNN